MKDGKVRSPKPRGAKRSSGTKPGLAAGRAAAAAQFSIVGVGASAGGLDAFKRLFGAVPADCGLAFVLVQHLDPTRPSLTADIVGSYTRMRVMEATDGMRVEPDGVYVIPPNKYLSIREGVLRLSAPSAPRSMRMAIDHFFYSLAEAERERAIGIILSGTGTDGTLGMKEIKAAGGMTMAQTPETAQHDGMPRSAIAAGSADYVLPPERMPEALLAYVRHAAINYSASPAKPEEESTDPLTTIVAALQAQVKFDFSGYRRGTLERRIRRRMSLRHVAAMSDYVELLRREPTEAAALFDDLLISVTSFFRDPAAWQTLQEQAIRPLVADKERDAPLRVWVPACATGEEAYSIAMILIEEIEASGKNHRLQVFASDVDVPALERARAGVYPEGIAARISPERLSRFFVKGEHSYQVTKDLRDGVVFAQQSLIGDPPFSRLDVISCRNFLIYLEPAVQEKIVALLHFALVKGGCLFLGSAESVGARSELFEPISRKWRIYRRVGPTRHDTIQLPVATAPGSGAVWGRPRGEPTPSRLAALAQQLLVQRYAPACVVIDRNAQVLYFHGRTDDYLVQPSGLPTRDLIAQARGGLRSRLRGAVREAMRGSRRVVASGVQISRGSASPRVRIAVEPLDTGNEAQSLWLVSFEGEAETASPTVAADADGKPGAEEALVHQLEGELRTTKEDLQHTIEDLSTANEELMSVTEEMQSSNEELETSKEELQSLNEELTTANAQLESKIGELEASNNDLDNLLTSTNIGTLFLDTRLRIRGFTPAATRLFSLISSDVGRPVSDIAPKVSDPALLSDAAAVLEKAESPKKEVQGHDGRWYVRQVLPYRTRDGRTEGVVVTFSDVAAEALHEARLYAEAIVDTVREPLLVLDEDLRVRSANPAFYETFRSRQEETVGRLLYELGSRQFDIPELRARLREVLSTKRVLDDFEVVGVFESMGRRILLLNARAIERGTGRPELVLLGIEDITERRLARDALREGEARREAAEQVRERQAQLEHALRISTVGVLASGLAHELSQPLSAIANEVEACVQYVASGKIEADTLLGLLEEVSADALRAGEIVDHLRGFIQKGEPQPEQADLSEIAHQVARLLGSELEREGITLRLEVEPGPIPIFADRIQIEQVVVNFVQNAIDAVRADGDRREIALKVRTRGGRAELEVRDTGAGVLAAAGEHLWEPFFTTKPHGLGMGLAISRSIIEGHRGRIRLEPPADGTRGTIAGFTLPLSAPATSPERK